MKNHGGTSGTELVAGTEAGGGIAANRADAAGIEILVERQAPGRRTRWPSQLAVDQQGEVLGQREEMLQLVAGPDSTLEVAPGNRNLKPRPLEGAGSGIDEAVLAVAFVEGQRKRQIGLAELADEIDVAFGAVGEGLNLESMPTPSTIASFFRDGKPKRRPPPVDAVL